MPPRGMPNQGSESLSARQIHTDEVEIGRTNVSGRGNSVNYEEFLVDRDFLTLLRSVRSEILSKKRETTLVSSLD